MISSSLKFTCISLLLLVSQGVFASFENFADEQHNQVVLRMIGHQILLHTGDSTSRVLPIQKDEERYKIEFENEFEFNPEEIVSIIDSVIKHYNFSERYWVGIENCETKEWVYNYEIGNTDQTDIVPCRTRTQPVGCYNIWFSLLPSAPIKSTPVVVNEVAKAEKEVNGFLIGGMLILLLVGGGVYAYKKKSPEENQSTDILEIGKYKFDTKNMELSFLDSSTTLTSKETDLLSLLFASVNTTVEREVILQKVWGDEGDYIGRTLDVFISKLRKKLEEDANIKIVNIRGVGYKMILN